MNEWAKILFLAGGICFVLGLVVLIAGKVPWIGRLPGDITIRKEHVTFYFPLTTCVIVSIFLSLIFLLFGRR